MAKKVTLRIDKGSTLWDLARILGTSVDELKKYNNLNSDLIRAGDTISWLTNDVEGVKNRLQQTRNTKQRIAQDKINKAFEQKQQESAARNREFVESQNKNYGDLTENQIRDYQNFKKMGLGESIQDFKTYKEKEHRDAQSTKDLTQKAGYGIVGAAAVAPILANPAGLTYLTKQVATAAIKHTPGMIRDAIVYEKAIDPATTAIADATGLEGTSRTIFKNGLGFGLSGISSKIMDRGVIAGLQKLRNSLDDLASRGGIMGKQVTDQMGRNFTKAANTVENVQNQATKVMDPLRTLNTKEAIYDSASSFTKNALVGTAYGAIEEESPIGATIVAPLTSIGLSKATHGIKRFAGINSKGQKSASQIVDKINSKGTPYQGFLHTTRTSNRLANGQKAAYAGLELPGGMQDVAHTANGTMPLMYKWTSVHKGNTYKSPYWEEVNPQRFMASKMMAPYENTSWMARRSYGDTMDFFSPQSYDEFVNIAKNSYNKDRQSMYNWLKQGNLKYDIAHEGDLIIGRNSNKTLMQQELERQAKKKATYTKKGKEYKDKDVDPLITYNQNGNRQSSQLFKTNNRTEIHLGSDFGGTGSGGNTEAHTQGLKGWLIGRLKSSMDLGAYSLPVTGQIQRAIKTKNGKFITNNVEAYHINGLPIIDVPLATKKLIHFNNGGMFLKIYGL